MRNLAGWVCGGYNPDLFINLHLFNFNIFIQRFCIPEESLSNVHNMWGIEIIFFKQVWYSKETVSKCGYSADVCE